MMKRLLVSRESADSLAMGISQDDCFTMLDTSPDQLLNIYFGEIQSIETDHFRVDYGAAQLGILPFQNITESHHKLQGSRLGIGQSIMVQVVGKSEDVVLTTFISLNGSVIRFLPQSLNPIDATSLETVRLHTPFVSGKEHRINRDIRIVTLQGSESKTLDDVKWDLKTLNHHWNLIKEATVGREPPFLIHQEHDALTGPIIYALSKGVSEIFVDDKAALQSIKHYLKHTSSTAKAYYYSGHDNIISAHSQISWDTVKNDKANLGKRSLFGKLTQLFSK